MALKETFSHFKLESTATQQDTHRNLTVLGFLLPACVTCCFHFSLYVHVLLPKAPWSREDLCQFVIKAEILAFVKYQITN